MKKTIKAAVLLLAALLAAPAVYAQAIPELPADQDVRIGKLDNGLTYYIRHNEYPKGQADFYIAQKVGSVLEEENQRGLAHFLEHMCFNGTTNFPGKNLINWLETVGVKFGRNLNAYTGVDQTVYMIKNVPTAREGVQDSCLLILHDWADDLLLLPEEIDAERAVIHEEWRRSNTGQMRILEGLLPQMYPGERYGYRLPIGTMEVVDNFEYQALRDYYEKWYRPDNQGIIVVGDIDVDRIESKIKELFSSIKMPENPAERVYFPVADTQGTIYAIGHDKEMSASVAELMIKTDALPTPQRNTVLYYANEYVWHVIDHMLNTRLEEISSKPGAPFAEAGVNYGNFFLAKTKDAFTIYAGASHGMELPEALAAVYREVLRASRGGFTVSEYERAKAEYLSLQERSYNNRNQRENGTYVNYYVNNFLDNDPIPNKDDEYQIAQMIANMVTLDQINAAMKEIVTDDNRVVLAMMPDSEDGVYPTEAEFKAALTAVDGEDIEPLKETLKEEPLIPQLPAKGSIVSEKQDQQWGATVWTLSNGATVIVKPTKFKDDEVLFNASAVNGTAPYGEKYANSLTFMPTVLRQYGLGTYTYSDLQKYLAGKQVTVRPGFGLYTRSFSGFSTPKDMPTLMELIYMNFTNINVTEEEYAAMQENNIRMLASQEADPMFIFSKDLMEALYHSPRIQPLTAEVVKQSSLEQILSVCKAMTTNAADYTFTFVGNVDVDALRPLVEQYIASLPGNAATAKRTVESFSPEYLMNTGVATDNFTTKMETPQTWAYITTFGTTKYDTRNDILASIAGQIITKRLVDKIREEMGATYSISANGSMDELGPQNTEIMTYFPMKPEMKEETFAEIKKIIEGVGKKVEKEEFNKIVEYLTKTFTEAKEKNSPWLSAIASWVRSGEDTFNNDLEVLGTLTLKDVEKFVKDLLKQGNYRVVVLDPAE